MRERYRWLRRIEQLDPVGDHQGMYRTADWLDRFGWRRPLSEPDVR